MAGGAIPTELERVDQMTRIMLVTGGSRGIGAATALLGARQGYDVAINYRAESAVAQALVARIKAETGRRAIAVAGDMAVEADIKSLFASVDHELGPVSHLVNNAGITGRSGASTQPRRMSYGPASIST